MALTFCILGYILMIFVLFKWTDGEKPQWSRRLAARTKEQKERTPQFFLILRKRRVAQPSLGRVSKARQT
jgi:hypothetical protein